MICRSVITRLGVSLTLQYAGATLAKLVKRDEPRPVRASRYSRHRDMYAVLAIVRDRRSWRNHPRDIVAPRDFGPRRSSSSQRVELVRGDFSRVEQDAPRNGGVTAVHDHALRDGRGAVRRPSSDPGGSARNRVNARCGANRGAASDAAQQSRLPTSLELPRADRLRRSGQSRPQPREALKAMSRHCCGRRRRDAFWCSAASRWSLERIPALPVC